MVGLAFEPYQSHAAVATDQPSDFHAALQIDALGRKNKATIAPTAMQAPAANVKPGPPMIQSAPAVALATNVAAPTARSNIANAVPRRSAGASSAMDAARRP
jgi:hypothetical protein